MNVRLALAYEDFVTWARAKKVEHSQPEFKARNLRDATTGYAEFWLGEFFNRMEKYPRYMCLEEREGQVLSGIRKTVRDGTATSINIIISINHNNNSNNIVIIVIIIGVRLDVAALDKIQAFVEPFD
ncbi:hypothetical protein AK812_SmicGene42732 [Symbiodinium microadriaticum]|uniref:Uncharacterized protein n=1 Tax=Symbiodinium microadriaticum TaxID=2951 RepID=A0A1Q9C2S9_SYMMI|nr:hypothetical protein AK812_SmicGene42732 [Symbiodinium microadriaticum]